MSPERAPFASTPIILSKMIVYYVVLAVNPPNYRIREAKQSAGMFDLVYATCCWRYWS